MHPAPAIHTSDDSSYSITLTFCVRCLCECTHRESLPLVHLNPSPLPLRHPVPPPFAHPSIHPGLSTHPSMLSLHHYFLRTNWQRVRPPLLEHQPKPARPSYQPLLPHFRACPKCLHQVEGTISASTVKSVALASVYSLLTARQDYHVDKIVC